MYPRLSTDEETVETYTDNLESLPLPVVSASDDPDLDMVGMDGRHTILAHKPQGHKKIRCRRFPVSSEVEILAEAARLNVSHGLPLRTIDRKTVAVRLWQGGLKAPEIADSVGRSERTVRGWLKPHKDNAKEARARKALALHEQGLSHRDIAAKLGTSKATVTRDLKRAVSDSQSCQTETPPASESDDQDDKTPFKPPSQKNAPRERAAKRLFKTQRLVEDVIARQDLGQPVSPEFEQACRDLYDALNILVTQWTRDPRRHRSDASGERSMESMQGRRQ
jgi:transposase